MKNHEIQGPNQSFYFFDTNHEALLDTGQHPFHQIENLL